MTDIRTLLHEAAPAPRAPLDMAAVQARSGRRPWRRVAAWVAGLSVVVGAGVASSGSLLVTSDGGGPDREAAEANHIDDTTTTTVLSGPDSGPSGPAHPGVAAGPPAETSSHGHRSSDGGVTTTTSVGEAVEYPAAEACSIDNAGLGAGERRTCRFLATADGGAHLRTSGPTAAPEVDAEGTVTVIRNGERTTYAMRERRADAGEASVFLGCRGDFIQPGDLVEVTLVNSTHKGAQTSITTLSAGKGYSNC